MIHDLLDYLCSTCCDLVCLFPRYEFREPIGFTKRDLSVIKRIQDGFHFNMLDSDLGSGPDLIEKTNLSVMS